MNHLHEHDPTPPTRAEQLLVDPEVQEGLRKVFSELDNLYNGIETQTDYRAVAIDKPSITPDGQYIEASKVALPIAEQKAENYYDSIDAHHASAEYMIFSFNLADLKDTEFSLRPLDLTDASIETYRGSGIDIALPDDGPRIHLPQITTVNGARYDGMRYNGTETDYFRDLRKRLKIEL